MTSRVDQCNAVLAGATESVIDTLQRVMNAAARVVSETRTFHHGLTQILHDDLHWLDVAARVTYKLGVIMHRCRHGKALQYLVDCCTPVTDVVGRQRLRCATAATQQLMVVPGHRLSTAGRRAICHARPYAHAQWKIAKIGEKQRRRLKFPRLIGNRCHWVHFRWKIYDRK